MARMMKETKEKIEKMLKSFMIKDERFFGKALDAAADHLFVRSAEYRNIKVFSES